MAHAEDELLINLIREIEKLAPETRRRLLDALLVWFGLGRVVDGSPA